MNSSNTSTEIRVCLDTNILVSALLFGGKPDEILDLAARKQIKIISRNGKLRSKKYPNLMKDIAQKAALSHTKNWKDVNYKNNIIFIFFR